MRRNHLALCAALLAAGLGLSCEHTVSAREEPKQARPVRVQPVEYYRAATAERYSADIKAASQVEASFKVGGYVQDIAQVHGRKLQEGDMVRRGELLARVRPAEYDLRVSQNKSALMEASSGIDSAKLQVQKAELALAKAQTDYQRARYLFERESLTKPEFDGAKLQFDMARADADSARAQLAGIESRIQGVRSQLRQAEISLEDSSLRAPMDGQVFRRNIEVGSLVAPGASGFLIADTRNVKAVFSVPDVTVSKLRTGQALSVASEAAPGAIFHGRITAIAPSADPRSRLFDIEVTLPNPRQALRAGMIASLELPGVQTRHALVVPLTAVVRDPRNAQNYAVFVAANEQGKLTARARPVKLGEAMGNFIAVEQGLAAGDHVITSGATLITDGEHVQVIP